jgi:hypothetical protein
MSENEMNSSIAQWLVLIAAFLATACGNSDQLSAPDGGGTTSEDAATGQDFDGADAGAPDSDSPDGATSCQEGPCSTEGARRCDGDDLLECKAVGGCLVWRNVEACADSQVCSAGQCVDECQDACSTRGARQCSGGGAGSVVECRTGAYGCLEWEVVETCEGEETCSNGECSEQCSDECSAVNDRACEADGYKLCGDFDADPCLDWGDVVPCTGDATCSNGYCAVQCTDECSTAGMDSCVAGTDAVHTCGDYDADSCLEWNTATNCGQNEECENGACVVVDPCAGVVCDNPPADTCVGDAARRFEATGNCNGGGCDYDFVDTHCPDGCQNGACLAPTCGGTTCGAPPANTCASSAELTRYFPLGTCDDATDTCTYQSTTIACSEGCFQGACIQGSWETEHPPLAVPDYSSMDITFDAAGNPHIAYCTDYLGDLVYRWRDSSGWHEETVDPGLGWTQQSKCEVAIGLDSQGRPMIAYHDPTNQDLRFARLASGSWMLDLVATSGFVGRAPSVATTESGKPIVAFHDVTTQELETAIFDGSDWQLETVDTWSGAASPITEIRRHPSGEMHILAGSSRSVARSQGGYDQPEVYLHTKTATGWEHMTVHEDGFVNRDGIALAPNGDVFVQVGVVRDVGLADEVRVVRVAGSQIAENRHVRSISNLLYDEPIGVFNTDSMTEVTIQDELHYRLDEHGYWVQRTTPADGEGILLRVLWELGDPTFRLLRGGWRITEPSVCVPDCSGKTCGNDGCGGTCGSCTASETCNPLGACTGWQYETPDAWMDLSMLATGTDELHTFGYDAQVDGLMHSTNASGVWNSESTGVDPAPEPNAYSMDGAAVDSTGGLHIVSLEPRPTHYNAWDKIVVFSDTGTGWTSTVTGELFRTGEPIEFAIDGSDVWHFAFAEKRYPDYSGSQLTYATYESGTWTDEVIVTPEDPYDRGNGRATNIEMVVDSQGNAHILWIETLTYTSQVSLHHATNASGSWVDTAIVEPYEDGEIGLAIDSTGTLHAAYVSDQYNTPGTYGTYDNGTWTWEDAPLTGWEQFGLDPQGVPFVAEGTTDGIDIHRRQAAGHWMIETIPVRGYGTLRRILFDDAANTHVIYRGGGGDSQYQTRHVWK